nr:MAG TPA: hypothetical protein [Caudoviricetes sp.]
MLAFTEIPYFGVSIEYFWSQAGRRLRKVKS